ncbi:MAG: GTP cyclohydrolase II [Candidatus Micrarchaeota archaeon]
MIKLDATSTLPTRSGEFIIKVFSDSSKKEHVVLVKGEIKSDQTINVRIHSKCFTGDTLTSLRCDCREQLEFSMEYIQKNCGILIYLDQEGRGIGLSNKIKAYALQDKGRDTVQANQDLGFGADLRDYNVAVQILSTLGIKQINILTNNPEKLSGLENHGIKIVKRIPINIEPNKYNKKYLETKKNKMGHLSEQD